MGEEFSEIKDIPKEFYQDSEGTQFKKCTFCGEGLSGNVPYLIEKSIKNNKEKKVKYTLFEYAICYSCSVRKMEAMSEESVQNIQAYMAENVLSDVLDRGEEEVSFEERIKECPVTNKSTTEMDEYSMVGQFIGDKMIVGQFPFVMNSVVGESMQDLLSEATKKEFDDFMDTITGIPPELRSLFKTNRPVLV